MNKFFSLAILTFAVGPIVHPPVAKAAEQKEIVCSSQGVADAGYGIVVAKDLKTAVLSEESFAGARKVADMDCEVLPTKNFPDALNNYLVCRDARAVEGGLIVRFYSGGIAGVHNASVRAVTVLRGQAIESPVQFGNLNCAI
jgi:hypothetical protein